MDFSIRLLEKEELGIIIPLLRLLDNEIEANTLSERLKRMEANNYQCVGVFDKNEELIGCSGIWILEKYYVGKHIEPDNVIIKPAYQGQGIGDMLHQWIEGYAKEINCDALELNCYVSNSKGLKFWLNQGYEVIGYHCRKKLSV